MKVDFKTRFWEIDLLRGIAIIMMLVSNAITSLIYFDVINISNRWFWLFFARITAILFILLVGISLTLSYARIKDWNTKKIFLKYLKRGLTIFSWGLAITLVSWFFIREDFIVFGVLHLIGLAIIFSIPFFKKKFLTLIFAIFFILIGIYLDKLTFNTSLFIWLGLTPAGFSTVDYFPIFPWFGIVLVGMFVGNVLYKNYSRSFKLKDLSSKKEVKLLSFLGRHSLIIYLIHQPIIITLLVILGYITL
ncbi:DUF1624 domain-containing protein [Candidatus Woesearchaeota archaeon]|jgi:uncharacterized membrane protein|nr:DUF1624 domain-containing protein [Candidatus Woesearchaeota archaeon]MBT7403109.1 DUF1624 domain-containing protein [Candidatus Woesearchaeota archaeon]